MSLIILQNYVNRDSHRPSAPNFSPWKTTLEIASGIKSASGFDTSLKLAVPKGALLEPPGKTYSPWSKKSYGGATGKAGDVIGRKSEKSGSQVRSAVSQSVSTTKNYAPWSKQTGESVTKSVSASSKAVAAGSRNYSPFSRVGDIARKARGSGLEESKPVAATVTKAITSSPVTSSLPNKSYAPWAKQTKRTEAAVSGNLQTKSSTTLSSTAVKGNEIVSAGKTYAPWKKYGAASASTPASSTRVAVASSSPIVSDKVSSAVSASAPSSRNYSPFSSVGDIARRAQGLVSSATQVAVATAKSVVSDTVKSYQTSSSRKSYAPWAAKSKATFAAPPVSASATVKSSTKIDAASQKSHVGALGGSAPGPKTYAPWNKYGAASSTQSSPSRPVVLSTAASERVPSPIVSSAINRNYSPYGKVNPKPDVATALIAKPVPSPAVSVVNKHLSSGPVEASVKRTYSPWSTKAKYTGVNIEQMANNIAVAAANAQARVEAAVKGKSELARPVSGRGRKLAVVA